MRRLSSTTLIAIALGLGTVCAHAQTSGSSEDLTISPPPSADPDPLRSNNPAPMPPMELPKQDKTKPPGRSGAVDPGTNTRGLGTPGEGRNVTSSGGLPGVVGDPLNPPAGGAGPITNRNTSSVGRVMPPISGRGPAGADPKAGATAGGRPPVNKAAMEAEMVKAQKAAEARNKAWDTKMRKTMSSICTGC